MREEEGERPRGESTNANSAAAAAGISACSGVALRLPSSSFTVSRLMGEQTRQPADKPMGGEAREGEKRQRKSRVCEGEGGAWLRLAHGQGR